MNIIHMDLRLRRGFQGRVREKERFSEGKKAHRPKKSRPNEPGLGCPEHGLRFTRGLTCKRTEDGA